MSDLWADPKTIDPKSMLNVIDDLYRRSTVKRSDPPPYLPHPIKIMKRLSINLIIFTTFGLQKVNVSSQGQLAVDNYPREFSFL